MFSCSRFPDQLTNRKPHREEEPGEEQRVVAKSKSMKGLGSKIPNLSPTLDSSASSRGGHSEHKNRDQTVSALGNQLRQV